MNKDEIMAGLKTLIADSLAVPQERVTAASQLIDDLGADSLDFVDILFQIEKKFGVQIKNQELNFLSGLDFSSPAVMKDGALTPEVVAKLKEWVPALADVPDPSKVTPTMLFSMISVETLARLIEKKLGAPTSAA